MTTLLRFCLVLTIIAASLFVIQHAGCSKSPPPRKPITIEEIVIDVYDTTREIGYTNRISGFLYVESNSDNRNGWQGWHIFSEKILDDYALWVDHSLVPRSHVQLTRVYPHQLIRSHSSGIQETVTMLDSVDALVVDIGRVRGSSLSASPLFSDSRSAADYLTYAHGNHVCVSSRHREADSAFTNIPHWIAYTLVGEGALMFDSAGSSVGNAFAPARISLNHENPTGTLIIVAGTTKTAAESILALVAGDFRGRIARRKQRMEDLLNSAYVRTNDAELNKALYWARLSMDALIMHQVKRGIFAGLPWFDNYWGRDSYISLTGATLVTGNFADAKEILRSFAEWQNTDPSDEYVGRIPNLVTTGSMAYNTADGTPRFTIAAGEYLRYSGDTGFAREIYPAVKLGIESNLSARTDASGFLMHGDAETWMDAVGPYGPWSPRGNRANDIQSLWHRQLLTGSYLARWNQDHRSASRWDSVANHLREQFQLRFVDSGESFLVDHINRDESVDSQFRPNQLFALDLLVGNPREETRARIFRTVTERLVYRHGVASLWQEDQDFHPFHRFPPLYVPDAAYHNGIVWTWLAGAWIDLAAGYHLQDLAYVVTADMTQQILRRGAVGTLSELIDAAPRSGETEPRLSGTFSQAWSLAEYTRVVYQSYFGITVDALTRTIGIRPRLPSGIHEALFDVWVGPDRFTVAYDISGGDGTIVVTSPASSSAVEVVLEWTRPDGLANVYRSMLRPNERKHFTFDGNTAHDGSDPLSSESTHVTSAAVESILHGIELARAHVRKDLRSMRGPTHSMLTLDQVKKTSARSRALFDAFDPAHDDVGTGSYTYPTNSKLKPGSLDLTRFTVHRDSTDVFFELTFRELSNPGWHPEYGFQLTFVAIVIDTDSKRDSGRREIGVNSAYVLPADFGYELVVYVGGGIRISDAGGNIIAEYLPAEADVKNPIGDTQRRTISFSLPLDLIGKAEATWRYRVLVGAQDDHGGAGMGEFRSVGVTAGEWSGGGKLNPNSSNVYDELNE